MADLELQRDSTAVVIMDYQNDIVGNYSTDGEALLQRSASVLQRRAGGRNPRHIRGGAVPGGIP